MIYFPFSGGFSILTKVCEWMRIYKQLLATIYASPTIPQKNSPSHGL